jgi:hypothetical protein
VGETKPTEVMQLPLGKLGRLRTFTASPDLKFLALSSRTRAGIWNLEANERVMQVRSFQSAYFTPNTTFFLDFPKFEKADREMVVLSPVTRQSNSRSVDKEDDVTFFGNILLRIKHGDKNRAAQRNFELDALDIVYEKPLWARNFPKQGPFLCGSPSSGKIVFVWTANSDGLRDEIARDAKLQSLWAKANPKASDYFLEVVDSRNGAVDGAVFIRTGKYSYYPEHIEAVGDWIVVADNQNRVLLYSISTGEEKAKWFGYRPEISGNGERLCMANGRGHLIAYDLRTFKQIEDLYFSNEVSAHLLSGDGSKLFVLTNDQTAFELNLEVEPL